MASGELSVIPTGTTTTPGWSVASWALLTVLLNPAGNMVRERGLPGCTMYGVTATRSPSGSAATAAGM